MDSTRSRLRLCGGVDACVQTRRTSPFHQPTPICTTHQHACDAEARLRDRPSVRVCIVHSCLNHVAVKRSTPNRTARFLFEPLPEILFTAILRLRVSASLLTAHTSPRPAGAWTMVPRATPQHAGLPHQPATRAVALRESIPCSSQLQWQRPTARVKTAGILEGATDRRMNATCTSRRQQQAWRNAESRARRAGYVRRVFPMETAPRAVHRRSTWQRS